LFSAWSLASSPRTSAESTLEKELKWLPPLAAQLPVRIPTVLVEGTPGDVYPFKWSVYEWLEGEIAAPAVAGTKQLAVDLADFILAIRAVDVPDGRVKAPRSYRGEALIDRDLRTRAAINACKRMIDADAATRVWDAALELPPFAGTPLWFHGDIKPHNILMLGGRLTGIIDFGCLAVGEPAVDQIVAWNLLTGDAREAFRRALSAADVIWQRGRARALSIGLAELSNYKDSNPRLAAVSRFQIGQVIADHGSHKRGCRVELTQWRVAAMPELTE
jgi:aminoglycoside phosphotransferase (APT) family kinase protein